MSIRAATIAICFVSICERTRGAEPSAADIVRGTARLREYYLYHVNVVGTKREYDWGDSTQLGRLVSESEFTVVSNSDVVLYRASGRSAIGDVDQAVRSGYVLNSDLFARFLEPIGKNRFEVKWHRVPWYDAGEARHYSRAAYTLDVGYTMLPAAQSLADTPNAYYLQPGVFELNQAKIRLGQYNGRPCVIVKQERQNSEQGTATTETYLNPKWFYVLGESTDQMLDVKLKKFVTIREELQVEYFTAPADQNSVSTLS